MNLKNKETQLFESLNKLDSIADLIKTSKEESSYLKKLSHQLENILKGSDGKWKLCDLGSSSSCHFLSINSIVNASNFF